MPAPDPRIDAYLAQAAPFARPILAELRARIHAVCPEAEETLKWKAPAFTYRGKLLAVMAAFKGHVAFNLWHGVQVVEAASNEAMGQFGRLTRLEDLPSRKAFAAPVKAALALIEAGAPSGGAEAAAPSLPWRRPRISGPPWRPTPRPGPPSKASRPASSGTTWTGSWRPSGRTPASGALNRPWPGWRRARPGTGSTRPAEPAGSLHEIQIPPVGFLQAPQGQVLTAAAPQAAVATGFLGGANVVAGPLHVVCPRFGRDFATVAAVALDSRSLATSKRVLVTIVARAENQEMKWNAARTSVGTDWGHGPTIAERVPATIELAASGPRTVYALKPDGTRARKVKTSYSNAILSFAVSPKDNTLHYEIVAK